MENKSITEFGMTADKERARLYMIGNGKNVRAFVTDYGASLVSLFVTGPDGKQRDVVLGYDDVRGYEKGEACFGATVGRCANRIAGAAFDLNGVTYQLTENAGGCNLHSGNDYYHKRMWAVDAHGEDRVSFCLTSPHMDQGYPGTLQVKVTYCVDEAGALLIDYEASADRDTIVNLTNHSYFNLNGHAEGSVLSHLLRMNSRLYTPSAGLLPTGELRFTDGTRMDFRKDRPIGGEYDDNFVPEGGGCFRKIAWAQGDVSGIQMETWTDRPTVQLYTANFLSHEPGKKGTVYEKNGGFCLETQFVPDAIHLSGVEKPILRAGEQFRSRTMYRFV